MRASRYRIDSQIKLGQQLSTSTAMKVLRERLGRDIPIVRTLILTGDDRLDSLAGAIYGDAKLWWVLAIASEIGWGLQVPPGTVIKVVDLDALMEYV